MTLSLTWGVLTSKLNVGMATENQPLWVGCHLCDDSFTGHGVSKELVHPSCVTTAASASIPLLDSRPRASYQHLPLLALQALTRSRTSRGMSVAPRLSSLG